MREDLKRQERVLQTVFEDDVGALRPLSVHLGGVDVHLLQILAFGPEKLTDELEGFSLRA